MIKIQAVTQRFQGANGPVDAVRNVELTINKGEIFGIIGRSGAGKQDAAQDYRSGSAREAAPSAGQG